MSDATNKLNQVVTEVQAVVAELDSAAPSFADQVLAAVQPVFESAGWTAPTTSTPSAEDQPAS